MSAFLVALLVAFGVVVLVELPDKTLVATLVLSTRYLPRPALAGVATAFAVQCAIALGAWVALVLIATIAAVPAGSSSGGYRCAWCTASPASRSSRLQSWP